MLIIAHFEKKSNTFSEKEVTNMHEFKCRNIEILRKSKGLTVEEMMKILGRTRELYYHSWRKGNINAKDVIRLHEFFNVSTDCILDLTDLKIGECFEDKP